MSQTASSSSSSASSSSAASSSSSRPVALFHSNPDPRPLSERIFLFDVDGTLTESRKAITPRMDKFLEKLRQRVRCAIVGGSDLHKQVEQLGPHVVEDWDYVFSENGLVAYRQGKHLAVQSLKLFLGEEKIKKFVNFCLHYIADLDIPVKRGTFVEFRNGMINISPIGRNCSQNERDEFETYDHEHHIRVKFIEQLKKTFPDYHLVYSIGGQISFDVFPTGWDKTYCLPYLEKDGFKEIHFFGDKTFKGGNDHEIFESEKTVGHTVKNPEDTIKVINELFAKNNEPTIDV